MEKMMISVENVSKLYHLGTIGGGTLQRDLQSWWARRHHREDPNTKVTAEKHDNSDAFWALRDVNLSVKRGEALGIIGRNGAGKSTLLKLLSRVTAPTDGIIRLNGRVSSLLEIGTGFHPELTGRENIYLNGAILGMSRAEVTAKLDRIIAFSECEPFIDTPVKRYSSGMYVKLAFAVAAHLDSEILIMDEVLAVGDYAFQQKCIQKMRAVGEEGRTILYVSHRMETIRQLCDRCVVLDKGHVAFDGDTESAIRLYTEQHFDPAIPLADRVREKRPRMNGNARMLAVTLPEATVTRTAPVSFSLTFSARKTCENVCVGITAAYRLADAVGYAQSPPIDRVLAGETVTRTFSLSTEHLASGEYFMDLTLVQQDDLGGQIILDHVEKALRVTLLDDCRGEPVVRWDHRRWGSADLGCLDMTD